jgi:parallel beta-helix repeat protein
MSERRFARFRWPLVAFVLTLWSCSSTSDTQGPLGSTGGEGGSNDVMNVAGAGGAAGKPAVDAAVNADAASTASDGGSLVPTPDAKIDVAAAVAPPGPRALDLNPNCKVPGRPANATSVQTFGAKPDDNVDDSEAFNKAVTAAGEGGTIYVPAGVFDVRTNYVPFSGNYTFELLNKQTLLMEPNTTLRAAASNLEGSAIIHIYKSSDVTIVGGKLIGDRKKHMGTTGEYGMGVRSAGARNLRIVRTQFSEFWGDGIVLSRGFEAGLSEGVTICGVVSDNNRRQGLSITGANNVLIEDSSFTNTVGTLPEGGIDLEPDDAGGSTKITIRHCSFSGNRVGVYFTALPKTGKAGKDVVLERSVLENNLESGVLVYDGENIVVRDNLIRKNKGDGLVLKTTLPVLVEKNTIEDNTGEGIHLEPSQNFDQGESHKHQIRGNTVRRSGAIGMRVIWSHDNALTDNVIEDSSTFGLELHVSHRNLVSGNTVKGSGIKAGEYAGLLIDVGDDNQIAKNTLQLGTGTASYGIWIKKFNNNRNKLQENQAAGSGSKKVFYDQGTGTVIVGNQGF